MLGALYNANEGEPGEQTIFLSEELWERRFGTDPQIVGRTIEFYEQTWQVRGVMPRGFGYPTAETDYWIPLRQSPFLTNRGAGFLHAIGRLGPGVSLAAASQELSEIHRALNEAWYGWPGTCESTICVQAKVCPPDPFGRVMFSAPYP